MQTKTKVTPIKPTDTRGWLHFRDIKVGTTFYTANEGPFIKIHEYKPREGVAPRNAVDIPNDEPQCFGHYIKVYLSPKAEERPWVRWQEIPEDCLFEIRGQSEGALFFKPLQNYMGISKAQDVAYICVAGGHSGRWSSAPHHPHRENYRVADIQLLQP